MRSTGRVSEPFQPDRATKRICKKRERERERLTVQQAILGEADAAVKVKVDVRQLLLALESRSGATLLLKEVRGLNL